MQSENLNPTACKMFFQFWGENQMELEQNLFQINNFNRFTFKIHEKELKRFDVLFEVQKPDHRKHNTQLGFLQRQEIKLKNQTPRNLP